METTPFSGFLPPTSSTTYTPNQFFDVVLRRGSRGAVRLVAYLLRKTLGWCDAEGKPQEPEVVVSYRELEERAGIGHSRIAEAIRECLDACYIVQVRVGQPDRKGEAAVTACYALRWDEREEYVTDPVRFRGFYAGNGNLTYIPNQFFDHLVPQEPLSVVKVVGAVIRNTIGYQTRFGFRRQQVRLSITDLERITRLNRDTVRLALQDAFSRNYVSRLNAGVFDPNGGKESRPATYGIRWQDERQPATFGETRWKSPAAHGAGRQSGAAPNLLEEAQGADRSQNPHGEALPEPARSPSQNPHGDRSQNPHGIEITPDRNNTSEKQQQMAVALPSSAAAAADLPETAREAHAQLLGLGFDAAMARRLAEAYPAERIARQCAWLPRRNPCRNTLGLLRRAIEEDWPEPKADPPEETPGTHFARHFPQGWYGGKRDPLPLPSAGDVAAAEAFVAQLLQQENAPERASEWGREFGHFARRACGRVVSRVPSLTQALRTHGEEFLYQCRERRLKAQRQQKVAAQRQHEDRHRPAYLAYLRAEEEHLRREHPEAYADFIRKEAQQRAFAVRCGLSGRSLAAIQEEEARLARLRIFFAGHAEHRVYDFWGWDETLNPDPFSKVGEPDPQQQLHAA